MEDFSPALAERHDHARTAPGARQSIRIYVTVKNLGAVGGIVAAEEEFALFDAARDFEVGGESEPEDFEIFRHLCPFRRVRQAVTNDVVETINLVGEDAAVGTEHITVTEPGTVEGPVLWPVDREAAGEVLYAVAHGVEARIDAATRGRRATRP